MSNFKKPKRETKSRCEYKNNYREKKLLNCITLDTELDQQQITASIYTDSRKLFLDTIIAINLTLGIHKINLFSSSLADGNI